MYESDNRTEQYMYMYMSVTPYRQAVAGLLKAQPEG